MTTINIVLRMLNLWTTKLGSFPVSRCGDKPSWLSNSHDISTELWINISFFIYQLYFKWSCIAANTCPSKKKISEDLVKCTQHFNKMIVGLFCPTVSFRHWFSLAHFRPSPLNKFWSIFSHVSTCMYQKWKLIAVSIWTFLKTLHHLKC